MKKIFTFMLLLLFTASTAFAVRPKPGHFFVKTQSDGTQIVVERCGDGHNGVVFYRTQDDLVLVPNADGDLCYATANGNRLLASTFIAHQPQQRTAAELTFVQNTALNGQRASMVVQNRVRRPQVNRISSGSSSRNDGLGTYGQTAGGAVPSIGEFTMPVIMVEFSDVKFQTSTTQALLQRQYNEEGFSDNGCEGSVRDYFVAQSGGLFRPRFDVAAKVTLSRTRAYYGADKGEDNIDPNLDKFMNDALTAAAAAGVDFSKYVYQGGVPCVILLYAGQGEANSYEDEASNFLWPCEWDEDADFTLGGKKVHINSFFVGNEIQYDYEVVSYDRKTQTYTYGTVGDPMLEGIGTFCHEFGHALGLPDFYCTDYSHSKTALGLWDIMDMGSYLNDGYVPIGHTAYERNFLGWENLVELIDPVSVTLSPTRNHSATDATYNAVLIRNDKDPKEYYIFENRQPNTWYPEEMSGGMLGLHVAFNASEWTSNILNNDQSKLRMQVFAADGTVEDPYGESLDFQSDLFPGSKNVTQATNSGTPAMKAYTGSTMNKPIYRIAIDDENNITFNFLQEEVSTLKPGDQFDADGIRYVVHQNTDVYVTALETSSYVGDVVIPATVSYDNTTWKVVGIATDAFSNCNNLTGITLGRNIAVVEDGAMRNTPALKSLAVDVDNGNFEIYEGALYNTRLSEGTVLLDFANNVLNLPISTSQSQTAGNFSGPVTYQGVTLTATDGTTATRMWQAKDAISMRIYKNGTLTLSAPTGAYITTVTFTTSSNAWNITTANVGTLNGKTWTGTNCSSVTFTNTGGGTFIATMEVEMEGLEQASNWELYKVPTVQGGTFDVPDGVKTIRAYALENAGYKAVTLPTTLQNIYANALALPTLTTLVANGETPAVCDEAAFQNVDQTTCKLLVPQTALTAYKTANVWKNFFSIDAITTGITPLWTLPTDNNTWYDLQGRPVANPQHGIYIHNGQKVVR